jgi:hypothetical protein
MKTNDMVRPRHERFMTAKKRHSEPRRGIGNQEEASGTEKKHREPTANAFPRGSRARQALKFFETKPAADATSSARAAA